MRRNARPECRCSKLDEDRVNGRRALESQEALGMGMGKECVNREARRVGN